MINPNQVGDHIARHEAKRRAGIAGPYCGLDWQIHAQSYYGAHGALLAERKAFNTAFARARARIVALKTRA